MPESLQKTADRQPVERTSAPLLEAQISKLRQLFPEAVSEGKVDFDKLRATLGDALAAGPERFSFGWAGKSDAIALLQTPSRATLIPCPDESVNFNTTANLFVEGDNLEVLKLLYKAYHQKVKLIYIDPPYNTGQDFVYPDDFTDPLARYLQVTGQQDSAGNLLTSNPETDGRYHSRWLSMMYPRLFLARQLMRDDGLIFVSADDNELHHLRLLMNEVFGEENFVANISWEKRYTRSNNAKMFYSLKDSILAYRRSEAVSFLRESRTEKSDSNYANPDDDARGPWMTASYVNPATKEERPNLVYPIIRPSTGDQVEHPTHAWKYEKAEHDRHVGEKRLWWGKDGNATYPRLKLFLSEAEGGLVPIDLWDHKSTGTTDDGSAELKELFGAAVFDNPKPTSLICRMLQLVTQPDSPDIVLDFFAGSCTTAQAVLELNREDGGNRRFVMVQLPEPTENKQFPTIDEIGKERIRRVIAKLKNETGDMTRSAPEDLGFKVFKLAESHFESWSGVGERTPEAYQGQMKLFVDPLRAGWTPEGVLWEVAIKEGFGLNSRIEKTNCTANVVYRVTDSEKGQSFRACLDETLTVDIAKELGLTTDDLFVCRDRALTDTLAANLSLQCRLKTI